MQHIKIFLHGHHFEQLKNHIAPQRTPRNRSKNRLQTSTVFREWTRVAVKSIRLYM